MRTTLQSSELTVQQHPSWLFTATEVEKDGSFSFHSARRFVLSDDLRACPQASKLYSSTSTTTSLKSTYWCDPRQFVNQSRLGAGPRRPRRSPRTPWQPVTDAALQHKRTT